MPPKRPDAHEASGISDTDIIPILDERFSYDDATSTGGSKVMKIALASIGVLLIAGGIATAVVLSTSGKTAAGTSSSSGTRTPTSNNGASSGKTSNSTSADTVPTTASTSALVDPETDVAALTMLAIGDWGSTTGRGNDGTSPGSCCKLYSKGANAGKVDTSMPRYLVDYHAQKWVAELMGMSAAMLKPTPSRVLSHGDNIYWNGVGSGDVKYRMEETFEKIYTAPALQPVKWVSVAGNHDIGGSAYLCGDDNDHFRECTSVDEMLESLERKFSLQAKYTSYNGDRWLMKDHYFLERVTQNSVTVDILNLDTNDAAVHGASQVCCQCYGYRWKYTQAPDDTTDPCKNTVRGDRTCAGGDTDMYDKCIARIDAWAKASYDGALKDLKASTADFKIINTHFSPHYHMDPPHMQKWYDVTKTYGVHAWFNGHTHGFNHDVAKWNTHFFQNGAGGGIFSESAAPVTNNDQVSSTWVAKGQPYGFMELSFTKNWLKVQFVSFDKSWDFKGFNFADTTKGGIARGHCWFVPKNLNSPGVECKSSVNGVVGMPT
ncbi:hypothetical protein, variant [Aphanomyces invadans]|uniref:Calcineurin-like phosphoesterase domain-containing protein n=1 Tax=Aphanomyces invadans TaxID=157072 RepID=A0A024TXW7_9STRA|nr:hypothetical protein, variant [Aphanomyces invadans]XP_008872262.1 hypothetical protein H310_08336 [Aphanomyces invadans]ETV98833.1 hypothetical protein H310_08336 [Aphanomyces invadans]ETV98834.1 hypothetical protein, variant [Aphanomyces invadans]|eukprot:XP_008872261.1 hypothetical protein, variant [Aphanomyces invadans]